MERMETRGEGKEGKNKKVDRGGEGERGRYLNTATNLRKWQRIAIVGPITSFFPRVSRLAHMRPVRSEVRRETF